MEKNQLLKLYWKNQSFKIILLILLGWLGSLVTFLIPLSLGAFFDVRYQSLTNRGKLLKMFGLHLETLPAFFTFFFLVVFLKMVINFIERKSVAAAAEKYIHNLNYKLFQTQMNWPREIFNGKPYGNYLLRYSSDMLNIRNLIVRGLHGSIKDALFLITGLLILFLLNQYLTLLIIGMIFVLIPLVYWLDKRQHPYMEERENRKSLFLSYVAQSFSRFNQIKEKSEEEETVQKFKKKLKKLFKAKQSFDLLESIRMAIIPGIGYLMVGVILWQASLQNTAIVSAGELLVYVLILLSLLGALRRLMKASSVWQKGLHSLNKKQLLFSREDQIKTAHPHNPPSHSLDKVIPK